MVQPLVSVVIPFYSELDWLKQALESVENQTYQNKEVLVINDGSEEKVNGLEQEYDMKLKIYNKENGGPASARNLGIRKSNGKYIAFLDSDDIWLPQKLEKQIDAMERNGYKWSQHSYEMFWEDSLKTKIVNTGLYKGNVYKDCFISFRIQTSCVVVLKEILIKNNIYFPLNKRYGQDGAFYKKIAELYPLGYIDGVLSKFRIRGTNAGFRASVQLNSRATTWTEIKNVESIVSLLPKSVVIAYKLSYLLNKIIIVADSKVLKGKNNQLKEVLSKCFYLIPYFLFQVHSKNTQK